MNSPTWSACQRIKTKLEQTTRVVSLNSFREPTQKMNSTRPSRSLAHRIKRFCRLSVAAFFVAVLVFLGIGNGTELVSRGFRNDAFLVLVSTLGAALVYFLAYFLTLRDILGGSLPAGSASLRDRWSFCPFCGCCVHHSYVVKRTRRSLFETTPGLDIRYAASLNGSNPCLGSRYGRILFIDHGRAYQCPRKDFLAGQLALVRLVSPFLDRVPPR